MNNTSQFLISHLLLHRIRALQQNQGKTEDEQKREDSPSSSVNTGLNPKCGGSPKTESSYLVSVRLENSVSNAIPVVLTLMGRNKMTYVAEKANAPPPSDETVSQTYMA